MEVLVGLSIHGVTYNALNRMDLESCYEVCDRDDLCKRFTLRSSRCELKPCIGRFSRRSKTVSGVKSEAL